MDQLEAMFPPLNDHSMDKLKLKQQILENAIKEHQSVIDDFKTRIKEMRASEAMVNENQFDYEERSFSESINERIRQLAEQLNFANEEMVLMYKIKVEKPLHEEVTFGSVVITDKRNYFVSASVEAFNADGMEIFGLSTHAPVYKAMEGKKIGERFSYGDEEYIIKDIF